jgi:hypothetical protein
MIREISRAKKSALNQSSLLFKSTEHHNQSVCSHFFQHHITVFSLSVSFLLSLESHNGKPAFNARIFSRDVDITNSSETYR